MWHAQISDPTSIDSTPGCAASADLSELPFRVDVGRRGAGSETDGEFSVAVRAHSQNANAATRHEPIESQTGRGIDRGRSPLRRSSPEPSAPRTAEMLGNGLLF